MSEPRVLLEKEVRARVSPEEAEMIMVLADLYASQLGSEAINTVLTRLSKDIGKGRMDAVAG